VNVGLIIARLGGNVTPWISDCWNAGVALIFEIGHWILDTLQTQKVLTRVSEGQEWRVTR
jgi:hypothetical protein